jgi:hypothetical protein
LGGHHRRNAVGKHLTESTATTTATTAEVATRILAEHDHGGSGERDYQREDG